jgi:hypothetical protein
MQLTKSSQIQTSFPCASVLLRAEVPSGSVPRRFNFHLVKLSRIGVYTRIQRHDLAAPQLLPNSSWSDLKPRVLCLL